MKISKKVRLVILGLLILLIWITRYFPAMGEWYALHIYPYISIILSSFSSLFPFSLGDLFILLSIIGVVVYPFGAWHRGLPWKQTLLKVTEYLIWIYVWFYIAWGLNYFREDFYTRASVSPVEYNQESFQDFLQEYVSNLNASYVSMSNLDKYSVALNIKEGYAHMDISFGLAHPKAWQRVKVMMFSPFISKVGVSGYMGPFFSEFNLNGDLLPSQYPSTYAHEMAHLLGITSEAEANLYAYLVCTESDNPQIRFSGYFSLLSHVFRNVSNLLPEKEQQQLVNSIRPEIIQLYNDNRAYWSEKYSPTIGGIQDIIYEWYLKSNKISNGQKNYSEVIQLLLAITNPSKE